MSSHPNGHKGEPTLRLQFSLSSLLACHLVSFLVAVKNEYAGQLWLYNFVMVAIRISLVNYSDG